MKRYQERADFGNLGEDASYWQPSGPTFYDPADLGSDGDTGESGGGDTGETGGKGPGEGGTGGEFEDTGGEKKEGDGGIMGALMKGVTSGISTGVAMGVAGLCQSCSNNDKKDREKKKLELAAKYPLRDCSPYKGVAAKAKEYADCLRFNQEQLAKRDAEFAAWLKEYDERNGKNLTDEQAKMLEMVVQLCIKLKQYNPAFGPMKLKDVARTAPDIYHKLYGELQAAYPNIKNIDGDTILVLNPTLAEMTIDEIISRAQNMLNGKYGFLGKYTVPIVGASLLFLILGAVAYKRRQMRKK